MAPDVQESPFVKQLASSDRPTREKALESLRIYLLSNRQFTDLELLKLWKGLFFCLWHTPPLLPSQRLIISFSFLFLALPIILFIPFLRAFWITIISNYTSIPSLRLDKYLLLIRHYVRASFQYLKSKGWDREMVKEWRDMMQGNGEKGNGKDNGERLAPLSAGDKKVPNGVRYHILDVWVDELSGVSGEDGIEEKIGEVLMEPVRTLEREGREKIVRGRARDVLGDERVKGLIGERTENGLEEEGGNEEWDGFED